MSSSAAAAASFGSTFGLVFSNGKLFANSSHTAPSAAAASNQTRGPKVIHDRDSGAQNRPPTGGQDESVGTSGGAAIVVAADEALDSVTLAYKTGWRLICRLGRSQRPPPGRGRGGGQRLGELISNSD